MLMECEFCEQVIELSGLRGHYEEECEKFPISANMRLPEPGECPLCQKQIGEGEEAWTNHLVKEGCPKSKRRYGAVSSEVASAAGLA